MEQSMVYGRYVDFDSLRRDNLDVEPEIMAAGWRNFFNIREAIYQEEVYDFWTNAKLVDDVIVSAADNISIIVTEKLIVKVTECPSAGEKLTSKPKWMTKLNLNEDEINRQLYGENDPSERKTSSLVAKARVLHAILFNCILPRAGSRHLVTTLDEQCLFYLLNQQPIDLPFLIYQYMVKGLKDTNSYPYGILLTRIFRESGIRLDKGFRSIYNIKSSINSITIGRMGLKNLDKGEADSQKKSRTEGEQTKKKTPTKSSQSQSSKEIPTAGRRKSSEETVRVQNTSQQTSSRVRVVTEGTLKRKGETLLSDIPKQTKRSPRVRTLRQQEEKKSRELHQVENSDLRAPQATRSLVSILREDSVNKAKESERKRKLEPEKQQKKTQKSPRLIEAGALAKRTTTAEIVCTKKATPTAAQRATVVQKKNVVQEIVTTTAEEVHCEEVILTDDPTDRTEELSVAEVSQASMPLSPQTTDPTLEQEDLFQPLRKEDLQVRKIEVVHPVENKSKSIIIKEIPRKEVKVFLQPIPVDSRSMHLLNEREQSFAEHLQNIGKKPYPTKMTKEAHTIFPITENTVIKVVPDIQPRRPFDRNKGKEKLYPEEVVDEEIAEAVRLIDEACQEAGYKEKKVMGMFVSHHISVDSGTSGSRPSANDPVGGVLTEGQCKARKIGDMECLVEPILKAVLRRQPLWQISSIAEILPLLGRPVPRLPVPDDLDLPIPSLPMQPPTLQIIDDYVHSSDAYSTTVVIEEEQPKAVANPKTAPNLQAQVNRLEKDVKKIKKLVKKLVQYFRL